MRGFWHVAEIQIERKEEVNKIATHVLRQEHNAGCAYLCIKAFRKVPHFKGYNRIFIENFLSNCKATFSVKVVVIIKQLLALDAKWSCL